MPIIFSSLEDAWSGEKAEPQKGSSSPRSSIISKVPAPGAVS